jgi:DNA-binding transcriptional MocR family regulator
VAPGLRLGWINAAPALVDRLAEIGYVDSGGGVNHATALTMAGFAAGGAYERHLETIRSAYRERRDRLVAAVREHLPSVRFTPPGGGWFLWLGLPAGVSACGLLARAEAGGVSYLPGSRFFVDGGGDGYLRLSFSMVEPDLFDEGTRRLASVLTQTR